MVARRWRFVVADSHVRRDYIPTVLCGLDGEPPTYVSAAVAETADDAVAYAVDSGEISEPPTGGYEVRRVLLRELDPIACKIRGVDDGWWVECTARSKKAAPFWRIDG
jgi:hypothetical protein